MTKRRVIAPKCSSQATRLKIRFPLFQLSNTIPCRVYSCTLFPDAVFSLLPPTETRYKNRFCRFCNPPCVDAGCTVPPSRRNGDCRSNPGSSAVRPPLLNMLFRFNGVSTELNVNGDVCIIFQYVSFP